MNPNPTTDTTDTSAKRFYRHHEANNPIMESGFRADLPEFFLVDEPVSRVKLSPESWDSSEEWVFSDGSKVRVINPGQGAFCAYVRVID